MRVPSVDRKVSRRNIAMERIKIRLAELILNISNLLEFLFLMSFFYVFTMKYRYSSFDFNCIFSRLFQGDEHLFPVEVFAAVLFVVVDAKTTTTMITN
jgi:hypothetical protein